jgi:hypothetical protein
MRDDLLVMVLEFWGVRIVAVSPSRGSCAALCKVVLSVALWDVPSRCPQNATVVALLRASAWDAVDE